jgi:hypothetical protein
MDSGFTHFNSNSSGVGPVAGISDLDACENSTMYERLVL